VGSISDHIGRRPVIFGALVMLAVAMGVFVLAHGPGWLIAARFLQGLATGAATSALGAALVDVDGQRGPMLNSLAPLSGMAVGSVGTAALAVYAPFPLHLVYVVILAAIAALALLLWATPETGRSQAGALASLRPRITVPRHIRRALYLTMPINVAMWALGGFYLSLVPSVVSAATGNPSPLVGGLTVSALTASGTLSVFLLRKRPAETCLTFGTPTVAAGILMLVMGVHGGSAAVLVAATLVIGAGFGANFLGCLRAIVPLAAPDERAELLAAFYVESYLAFSVPAILAGFSVRALGLETTTDIYAAAVILFSGGGLLAMRLRGLHAVPATAVP
jgi:MFS family permease